MTVKADKIGAAFNRTSKHMVSVNRSLALVLRLAD